MTNHITTPNEYVTKRQLDAQDDNIRAVASEKAWGHSQGYLEFKKGTMENLLRYLGHSQEKYRPGNEV